MYYTFNFLKKCTNKRLISVMSFNWHLILYKTNFKRFYITHTLTHTHLSLSYFISLFYFIGSGNYLLDYIHINLRVGIYSLCFSYPDIFVNFSITHSWNALITFWFIWCRDYLSLLSFDLFIFLIVCIRIVSVGRLLVSTHFSSFPTCSIFVWNIFPCLHC